MSKVHARSKGSKLSARKAPKPGTTAADRQLLAQAAREDDERPLSQVSVRGAIRSLRLGCDQLSQAIAGARQDEDFDTVDNLTPVLASIWSARMELGDGPEAQP